MLVFRDSGARIDAMRAAKKRAKIYRPFPFAVNHDKKRSRLAMASISKERNHHALRRGHLPRESIAQALGGKVVWVEIQAILYSCSDRG